MVLVRDGAKPLYRQVKEELIKKILSGEYRSDEKLPTERELCEMFQVSRITIRQALDEAIQEGFLYREHSRGTFVGNKYKRFDQNLEEIQRFEDLLKSKESNGGTEIVSIEMVVSDLQLSSILQTEMGEPLVSIKLLGLSDGKPVAFYHSYYPEDVGRVNKEVAIKLARENKPFSSIDLYLVSDGEKPNRVKQSLEAVISDGESALRLGLDTPSALMKVSSVFMTKEDRVIEYRNAYYLGDKYIFHLTRRLNLERT